MKITKNVFLTTAITVFGAWLAIAATEPSKCQFSGAAATVACDTAKCRMSQGCRTGGAAACAQNRGACKGMTQGVCDTSKCTVRQSCHAGVAAGCPRSGNGNVPSAAACAEKSVQ